MNFSILLFGMVQGLKLAAWRFPAFKQRLAERDLVVQIKLQDNSKGRYIELRGGKISSDPSIHPSPDVTMFFKNQRIAERVLTPPQDYGELNHAAKNFQMGVLGPDELVCWWLLTLGRMQTIGWEYGVDAGNGERRYVNNSNGGPMFVYVKDGKIVRMTPIEFDDKDAPSWSIHARGHEFKPLRKTSLSPHGLASKSMVYSKNRNLYPMKRVDFDPHGERNTHTRGSAEYERISWDEALDMEVGEFKRVKRECGPGAIALSHGSHHNWGNIGYYLSALYRFFNAVGFTKVMHNPDSWEGWYWGAMHHWGHSMRLGIGEPFGQVEDCLKNAEMIVFWSSDPETTSGVYAAYEATQRRMWAKQLGIKMVHIDPHLNHTAALYGGKWIAPKPGTDPALAQAICHVWITENLYDKEFVEKRTTGFDEWAEYILGTKDGTPKTPKWAAEETGVAAREIRALAREWGNKRTYLGAGGYGNGFGGACRTATGAQWARMMVILMGMQGLGKPGVNFGNLQQGTPVDYTFWFPGYAEGGISGDLFYTGGALVTYPRMPHLMTMNPVKQQIPRMLLPDAILEGKTVGYPTDPLSVAGQFLPVVQYPLPGHSPVQILYKYGGAYLGTMNNTNRWIEMYHSEKLPFVVSQSMYFEGETQFADVILPACTNFERWDIGEWASAGGYGHQLYNQLNHRVIALQHPCIEPRGESKSDYQIFFELAQRLGLGAYFSEGCSELDWCKRFFEASDVSQLVSWKEFLKKGYFVLPADAPEARPPTAYNWYYEGRKKDVPEPGPLPGEYTGEFLDGLQTQSSKFEFVPESLKKVDDPERPPVNTYVPSWEGTRTTELIDKYPLQLLSAHTRYSFHTWGDGKDSTINDIKDHRVLVDGHYYLVARINAADAKARGIKTNDLVKLFNGRGAVICAAYVTERLRPGVVHSYESSAVYDPIGEPGKSPDRGGCVNTLTNDRSQSERTTSMAPNACLIELELWNKQEAAA